MTAEKMLGNDLPENIRIITLPPYSPELNPVEELWNVMKDSLCNKIFGTLEQIEETITTFLSSYWQDARKVLSLVGCKRLTIKHRSLAPPEQRHKQKFV
ncbi:MAG: hypothetical protein HC845_00245 [Akkermansiaceae bacterium]|nr:hypothetical protein [Akkermansiaceae bacterium]